MDSDFYLGFIRLHVLFHASHEPIFGLGILRELERHGYDLSPGTLYPLLHRMEKRGLLTSRRELVGGRLRRVYLITETGTETLYKAREKVRELFGELFDNPDRRLPPRPERGPEEDA